MSSHAYRLEVRFRVGVNTREQPAGVARVVAAGGDHQSDGAGQGTAAQSSRRSASMNASIVRSNSAKAGSGVIATDGNRDQGRGRDISFDG